MRASASGAPHSAVSVWTFFGGKGGVGKTTCAASWALARADAGARVLLVSTDPAHSLSDVFNKRLAQRRPSAVARRLDALELDAPAAVSDWLKHRRPAMARLLDQGTLLDADDIARVLALPLPGLDELAAFLVLANLEAKGEYDDVVVDTAPTGHTRRLLDTPGVIEGVAELLEAMHERHAIVAQALVGRVRDDDLVRELRDDAMSVEARLHDEERTRLFWVALPEPVAVAETLDAIDWLRRGRFPLSAIVVNRLTPKPADSRGGGDCAECRSRVAYEHAVVAPLVRAARAVHPPTPLLAIAAQPFEPRGFSALRKVGQSPLFLGKGKQLHRSPARTGRKSGDNGAVVLLRPTKRGTVPLLSGPIPVSVRLLFFGGKGGVGKTTCAAAAALTIASRTPERTVRLISTDPAPSLGDVLSLPVGDRWTAVPHAGRLEVRELDAAKLFSDYRRHYQDAVEEFFDRIRGGVEVDAFADRAVFARLFDLAPPGLDEVMALLTVIELLQGDSDDLLIVDTAPTGHTLRLLALQDDVRQWVALLMQLTVKYRLAARAESLARELVRLSQRLRYFRDLLADPGRAQFVAVVRPSALPRMETARLFEELKTLGIATPLLIVNGETTGTCVACRRRVRGERRELARLRRLCHRHSRACDIIHAPLHLPPPRGPRDLLAWTAGWRPDGNG